MSALVGGSRPGTSAITLIAAGVSLAVLTPLADAKRRLGRQIGRAAVRCKVSRQGQAMLCTVAVWGAAFAGFAGAPGLWLTLSLLAVAGIADSFTVVFRGTIVAAAGPDQLRGRVMAADYVIGAGGGQLGNLEAGALGSLTSPTISVLTGGLVTIAGAVVIGLALPAFTRHRRQPAGPGPAPIGPAAAENLRQ